MQRNNVQMVEVPEGEIVLRDDRINREWVVRVESFMIHKYPVTQEQYFHITGESPSYFKGDHKPVENISWKDAATFCNLMSEDEELEPYYLVRNDPDVGNDPEVITVNSGANGYRLPTEAEWEYACKAGTTGIRYGEIAEIAWYKGNSDGMTHEVGQKEPNQWGIYDMLGNVWEWCSDIYDETTYGSYRIFRGGGWNDDERGCMATNRRRSHPTKFQIEDLGFRIARNMS